MKKLVLFVLVCFLLPAAAALGVHAGGTHPDSWRVADWSSSNLLPTTDTAPAAAIHVLCARTGGLKGALADHCWIVFKHEGSGSYRRYDKVGWGMPVRVDAYAPDGRWYSNDPRIVGSVHGEAAEALIPKLEAAIAAYPYQQRDGYRIWPGPNSNTFVATVLRAVPELDIRLPPRAIGKDYLPLSDPLTIDPDWRNLDLSLAGYLGLGIGVDTGIELRFGGLVLGADFLPPALKLPGFGRIGWPEEVR